MAALNLRRGFNRIFALLFIGWALFCVFVYPLLMAGKAKAHYDSDFKSCYKSYGVQGAADWGSLERCLSESEKELKAGTYSGFGFVWDEGEFWSLRGYYRHMGWMLAGMILVPPLLFYGLAWGVALVCLWIWRGFRASTHER